MRSDPTPTSDSGSETGIAAAGVLESLHRTVQGLALYSSDHPSVRSAAKALAHEVADALGSGGVLRFGVANDSILLESEELRSEALTQLATLLNNLDIAMIEMRAGCAPDEMLALACILCDAGRAALRGEELATEIDRATGGHVVITPLTFSGLSVREGGPNAGDGAASAGVEWGSLIDSVMSGGGLPVCAETVHHALQGEDEAGARAVGLRLVQACDDANGNAGQLGRRRIQAFVQSLRPETRRRIVDSCLSSGLAQGEADADAGANPGPGADTRGVHAGMTELFGADEVLSSLDRLERAGVELSPDTMKLFRKLSHLRPDPSDRDPGNLPEDPELRDSVNELMGIRGKGEFAPGDYVEQIDACVSAPQQAVSRQALDPEQVVLRKAEIALELLRDEKDPGATGTDSIFRFLREQIDLVIRAERVDLLSRGVRAAQRSAYTSTSAEGVSEPRELLAAIDDPERVAAILEAGGDAAPDRADLVSLFREVDFLLAHVPRILVDNASTRVNRAGADVLLAMSEAHLRPLIEALARLDLAALRALLEVLLALPGSRLAALVEPLRDDEDPRARRLAYRALDASGIRWGGEVLRRALSDPDRGVQRIALDHLHAKADHGAIETLCDYLQGTLAPRTVMWRDTYQHAARILTETQPDGEARACQILLDGRTRLGRANAARMREIAGVLEDREESVEATRAVRRWSRSIAHALGALTGAGLPEGGER